MYGVHETAETGNSSEGNEREKVSFKAFPENSERWSRGEVALQTLLEAATGNARSLTMHGKPCTKNCTSNH